MENNSKIYEIENRHCPICGNFVEEGSPMHRCADKDLNNMYKESEEEVEDVENEIDRTYDDKLNEFDEFYNSDNYYDNDTEEE